MSTVEEHCAEQDAITALWESRWDSAVDDATHAVVEAFSGFRLPKDMDDRGALMVELNDAIAAIMREWVEP